MAVKINASALTDPKPAFEVKQGQCFWLGDNLLLMVTDTPGVLVDLADGQSLDIFDYNHLLTQENLVNIEINVTKKGA